MDRTVIVFGKSPEIMARALAALADEGIAATGGQSVAEVMAALAQTPDALVAIGGGVSADERAALKAAMAAAGTAAPVIEVYGPGTLVPAVRDALRV